MKVYGYTLLDSAGAHCPDACVEPHGWDYVQDERYIAVTGCQRACMRLARLLNNTKLQQSR